MVKRDILERKLYQIEKSLRKIQVYTSMNYDEFISHLFNAFINTKC